MRRLVLSLPLLLETYNRVLQLTLGVSGTMAARRVP